MATAETVPCLRFVLGDTSIAPWDEVLSLDLVQLLAPRSFAIALADPLTEERQGS